MEYAPQPTEGTNKDQKVLEFFAEHAFPPVQITADEVVTVTMTSRFEVTDVRIRQEGTRAHEVRALELAMLKAVNGAVREVAERNAKRLDGYFAEPSRG